MMGKTMNEIGKTLFPNLTEERRQQIIADFGNEEINYLSQKGAILYEGNGVNLRSWLFFYLFNSYRFLNTYL